MKGVHADAALDRKMLLLHRQLHMRLRHFPRYERYALTQRIRNRAYDVDALIVEARALYQNKTALRNLNIAHRKLRRELQLAYELGYFAYRDGANDGEATQSLSDRRFHAVAVLVDEVGRIIGGWLRDYRKQQPGDGVSS